MQIIFINCYRINRDRDGVDFIFKYVVENESNEYLFHCVTKLGAQIAWHLTPKEELDYSKQVFPIVVEYFKWHWNEYNSLPQQNIEYWEDRQLKSINEQIIDWKNYVLVL